MLDTPVDNPGAGREGGFPVDYHALPAGGPGDGSAGAGAGGHGGYGGSGYNANGHADFGFARQSFEQQQWEHLDRGKNYAVGDQTFPINLNTNDRTVMDKTLDKILRLSWNARHRHDWRIRTPDGSVLLSSLGDIFVKRDAHDRVISPWYRLPDGSWNPKIVDYIDKVTDRAHASGCESGESYLPPGLRLTDIYRPGDAIFTDQIAGRLRWVVNAWLEVERQEREYRRNHPEEYNIPQSKFLWNGEFRPEYLNFHRERILTSLKTDNYENAVRKIQRLEGIKQFEKLQDEFMDERGLIRQWTVGVKSLDGFQFENPPSGRVGKILRENSNRALFAAHHAENFSARENAEWALDLVVAADKYAGHRDFQKHAHRLTEQANSLLRQDSGASPSINPLLDELMIRQTFGVDVDSSTFIGREIVTISEDVSRNYNRLALGDSVLHTILLGAINSAREHELDGDTRSALNQINQAWAVLDFANGFTKGIVCFTRDSVTGALHLAMHPIDSAEAIGFALVNYDKTWNAIYDGVKDTVQNFDSLSVEAKGKLIAEISATILATAIPGGSLKGLTKLKGLSEGVGRAAAEVAAHAKVMKNISEGKWIQVGRWMSEAEYALMRKAGRVLEGGSFVPEFRNLSPIIKRKEL